MLLTYRVVDSDQTWDAWVWNIHEYLIVTINGRIRSECKWSSPCCESLLVSNFPCVVCARVCCERTKADCRQLPHPNFLQEGPSWAYTWVAASYAFHRQRGRELRLMSGGFANSSAATTIFTCCPIASHSFLLQNNFYIYMRTMHFYSAANPAYLYNCRTYFSS